jgi:hypothetical protein
MLRTVVRTALLGVIVAVLVGGCDTGPKHPNFARYEYMYINGIFQPPYTAFPSGVERGDWKCFDQKIEKEFDCTFVRGGWGQYHYIYRERR